MAKTWTEKQIEKLEGFRKTAYNAAIAAGYTPREALQAAMKATEMPTVDGSSRYVGKGETVWLPGTAGAVDPRTGKKIDYTGGAVQAAYDLTNKQVAEIVRSQFPTLEAQNQLRARLVAGGYMNKKDLQTKYSWTNSIDSTAFLKLLADANADGSDWDTRLSMAEKTAAATGIGGPQISRSINISSPSEARQLVRQAGRAYLGRDFTVQDEAEMVKALTRQQEKTPSVTRTVSAGGTTTYRTTGGMNPQEFLRGQIMGDEQLRAEVFDKQMNTYGDIIARLAGA